MKLKRLLKATVLATAALGLGALSASADRTITLGFVTHAQGNPFIQQIVDGAQAAAKDLGVDARGRAAAGRRSRGPAQGRAELRQLRRRRASPRSVPGESMAKGLNEIIASGVPIVQYNLLVDRR